MLLALAGLAVFLVGLFLTPHRNSYTLLVETLLLLPGLLLVLSPAGRAFMRHHARTFLPLFLLLGYALVHMLAQYGLTQTRYITYSLEPGLFCATLVLLAAWDQRGLEAVLRHGCLAIAALSLAHIVYWYGFLGNPLHQALLSGHQVAGFRNPLEAGMISITAFFVLLGFQLRPDQPSVLRYGSWLAMAVLVVFTVLLQRRTGFVALGGGLLFALWLTAHRRAAVILGLVSGVAVLLGLLVPEIYTQRGLSYRPDVWLSALQQSLQAPLFGHGFGADVLTRVDSETTIIHAHNMHLGMFHSLGVVGLLAWLSVWLPEILRVVRSRPSTQWALYILPVFAAMIYGCFELGGVFSRINERWFITWLPIGLLLCYRILSHSAHERPDNPALTQ